MFFKQVWRNAAKNRRGNGLFFGSLVIAIIAFYTLLSLDKQDVMRFLSKMESDAVQKLMALVPVVYVLSLFFVLFLVYFACKYQMDSRRREFGMYLMLGMRHSRLFAMLFCETLWSSLVSLLIGLPAALFLTEGISLTTAKLVGLGIIGHRFTFSIPAVFWTICGFVAVQLMSMLFLCIRISNLEPAQFLQPDSAEKQESTPVRKGASYFALGTALLAAAYALGAFSPVSFTLTFPLLLLAGGAGTFLFYRGLGGFLGKRIRRKSKTSAGLTTFTGRQIQENVLYQYKTLTVSSLLLLMALSCISYGIGMVAGSGTASVRTTDFSIMGDESAVTAALQDPETGAMIAAAYPVYLSYTDAPRDLSGLADAIAMLPPTDQRDNILENISGSCEYILSLASYNQMLAAMGREPVTLEDHELALYTSMSRGGAFNSTLDAALKNQASITVAGENYRLFPELFYDNIVADLAITLYTALIVPDGLFARIAVSPEPFCWNVHLSQSLTEELGLMQAIEKMDARLSATGLEYESYLSGIGRNLFYTVAASYLTIYLGVLFLLISNTVIGLKYLIQQRENKHRYVTLLMLGADRDSLYRSSRKQIQAFFSLVLGVAVMSSIFAILSLFKSFTRLQEGTSFTFVLALSAIALALFVLTEAIYLAIVQRAAYHEIKTLKVTDRG